MTAGWQNHVVNPGGQSAAFDQPPALLHPTRGSDGYSAPEPIGLSAAEAAALLGVSESHFYALHKTARLGPLPVRMGRAVRWSRQELVDWFNAGSPPRSRWQALRQTPRHRNVTPNHS